MTSLFDMLTGIQAQQADISQQMAKQFGLQQEQAQKAMEALMPAFSQGLKRNASTPKGFADFMQALANGSHAEYMQNPMKAFTPKGMSEGNAILGHLFGSKDVSRAIAAQAEAASGVSQSILKQMLPALAPMIMGGLFQNMTGQPQQAHAQHFGGSAGGGILGQILEQMMKGGLGGPMGQPQTRQPQQQPRMRNPLEEMLEQMMGGGRGGQSPSGVPGGGNNPLGDIFNEMIRNGPLGGGMGGQMDDYTGGGNRQSAPPDDPYTRTEADDSYRRQHTPEPEASGAPQSPYPKGTGLEDLFGDLFKPSRHGVPEAYEKGIQDIFDQFLPRKR